MLSSRGLFLMCLTQIFTKDRFCNALDCLFLETLTYTSNFCLLLYGFCVLVNRLIRSLPHSHQPKSISSHLLIHLLRRHILLSCQVCKRYAVHRLLNYSESNQSKISNLPRISFMRFPCRLCLILLAMEVEQS